MRDFGLKLSSAQFEFLRCGNPSDLQDRRLREIDLVSGVVFDSCSQEVAEMDLKGHPSTSNPIHENNYQDESSISMDKPKFNNGDQMSSSKNH